MAIAQPYREVTPAALILGVITGALLTSSFVYIGLKLGFGLSGSAVAAIFGFALLRGVGRKLFNNGAGTIVENNVNQTIASGINTASSGIVFTFPALLLLGEDYNPWTVILAAIAGSFMGIVIIIPLRKQLIEIDRLRFPSGVAVATILRSPGAGVQKALLLGVGFAIGLGITLLTHYAVVPEILPIGPWIHENLGLPVTGPLAVAFLGTTLSLSTANFGAGLLSGRGGLAFALGGVLSWWFVGPITAGLGWAPTGVEGDALIGAVYGSMLRPVGIGVLIGGALAGIVAAFPAIKSAIKSLSSAAKLAKESGGTAEELSPKVLTFGLLGSFVALFAVAIMGSMTDDGGLSIGTAVSVAIAGTAWLGLAGLIVAQATGMTDISPLSGLALIAVTLMLALTGNNVVLAITIGVAVCVATNQCADMMTDLKTGHLVGGIPRKQQIAQFAFAWVGPAIAVGTVLLLWSAGEGGVNGFGPESAACLSESKSGCLPAPQADVLQGMVQSVVGGSAPLDKYLGGALIGGALAIFPISGLGVLIGLAMYLPFAYTLGYGLGCGTNMIITKLKGARYIGEVVVPIAAGLIVGEALTNLTLTLIKLASGGGGGH